MGAEAREYKQERVDFSLILKLSVFPLFRYGNMFGMETFVD